MVCTADDLLEWKDFPKGLRVLLLDQDCNSAAEIKLKLEQMDYLVSTFYNEDEALSAISNNCESFHVAIIEVSIGDSLGSFKFLETVKDLPIIMISNIHCLSTMMKCIALGAAEFLQKPLSEEKLRNIWQHVVHKAFNAGEGTISESLKPVKETVVSMLDLKLEDNEHEEHNISGNEIEAKAYECDHEQSIVSDRFPGPSTPQLKQGGRSLDDGDCQGQQIPPVEKDRQEQDGESKFVETTCNNSVARATTKLDPLIKQEDSPSLGVSKSTTTASNLPSQVQQDKDGANDSNTEPGSRKKGSLHPKPSANRVNRKKMKVDWTPDLHKRFVQAVEQLGVDQAIPSRILELMKAEGLTRHNVASHLQKYRLNKRHILPKEDIQNRKPWQYPRTTHHQSIMPRTNYQHRHHHHHHHHKPIMAYPPPPHPPPPPYHVWGHPSSHHHPSAVQMWGHQPGFPTWQHSESQPWPTYPAMNVDAWGCPVMPPPSQVPSATLYPQVHNPSGYESLSSCQDSSTMGNNSVDLHMDEEEVIIDRVMKEAISKPWLPLPLGLKPPSTESVLFELQRQGISNIPPSQHNNHH